MAVGKSAVGRNLAKRLGRRFVDLDRLIEKSAGMKVRERRLLPLRLAEGPRRLRAEGRSLLSPA